VKPPEDNPLTHIPKDELKQEPIIPEYGIPLWLPILAFVLIILSYLICEVLGIRVNPYYRLGVFSISGTLAAICAYFWKG